MSETSKILEIVGNYFKRTDSADGKRYGVVVLFGAATDASGNYTPSVPSGWTSIEAVVPIPTTLGNGAAVYPTVAATTFAVAFGGSAATTFAMLMVVSK